ncbi:ATP synthase F1 subunit delta [Leptospira sp. GIMC2001]|uniref:ATP synthase F1 subunit delta n=1 Tax=Leptospira sp. GIMC2001 TaxID=1513297 RepID=UPI002349BE85|nr:ATP synthase F1 subunit delta [Leptospira sp. GIMC2001]WCL48927.1 ATP synthase F1 subunit delta [Leptospira sp. GIMC2001]
MNQSQVSTVYSQALLDLVSSGPALEEVEGELRDVETILFTDPEIMQFILSPVVKPEEKETVLMNSLKGKVSEIVSSFIGVLSNKGRLEFFPEICSVFSEGVDKLRGRSQVTLYSREPMLESEISRIKKTLEEKFKTSAVIRNEISPDIVGGFVIRMNDYLVDASIQSKLRTIKESLLAKKITVGAIYEN